MLSSVICIGSSTILINFIKLSPIELNFWFIVPYTVAIGLIPAAVLSHVNSRIKIVDRQKQISYVLLISYLAIVLIFHIFFLFYGFHIILNMFLMAILSYFLIQTKKEEIKIEEELKNVSLLEFLFIITPFFLFFIAFFIGNILYNSFLFYRSVAGSSFFPFLYGVIVAFIISGFVDYFGRKLIVFISFGFVGLNWILASMFGYSEIISILDGIAYGLMIAIGVFTLSGDIIVESKFNLRNCIYSLFLAPIFLYDFITTYFLTHAVHSIWLLFVWDVNFSRNSLFSLMVGLIVLGIVLFIYSPETYPMTKKQKILINKYMMKAKNLAEKYKSE
ncbi:MAG: hypothetical protein HWN67_16070 [Candidatus Helarchaeota archaeon]|nr:hypothetical protein [Candidatus Helarchaeota archaeon]